MKDTETDLSRHRANLQGSRIELEVLTGSNHSPRYREWLLDPDVNAFLEIRRNPLSAAESIAEFVENTDASPNNLLFGMFIGSDRIHIGNIKLGSVNRNSRQADVGLLLGEKETWGKGYGTEAVKLVSQYAFDALDLHKLTAGVLDGNTGSAVVFKKAGYQLEGVLRDHALLDEAFVNCQLYSRLSTD